MRGLAYQPGFLDTADADALFQRLMSALSWQQESLRLYGRCVPVPRLVAWCGEEGLNYRYSGADHVCAGWLPELAALRCRLAARTAVDSNFVLVNRYRGGADHMGWHTDDERGLARTVASVSLGARRRFLVRPPATRGTSPGSPAGRARSWALDLEHGSLLLLDGALRHSLPRTSRPVGERINLTFRLVQMEGA